MQAEVAQSVIDQMGGQIDLLVTLALAICGGLTALLLQVILHNHDDKKDGISFKRDRLLFGCLICEGTSIILGYFARAAITGVTPQLLRLNYSTIKNWSQAEFDGNIQLRIFAGTQALLFIAGILLVVIFIVSNSNLLRKKAPDEIRPIPAVSSPRSTVRNRK
ncbi:MAG TPA: hypothetical protein VF173_07290 [Thermoanaerobaculia bacterium]|nr:hypothetical protein [Thermoanaerobaculia bacterium]